MPDNTALPQAISIQFSREELSFLGAVFSIGMGVASGDTSTLAVELAHLDFMMMTGTIPIGVHRKIANKLANAIKIVEDL